MNIGSVFSLLGSQESSLVQTERKKTGGFASKNEAQGDTVSISEEARTLLANMSKLMKGVESNLAPQEEAEHSAASSLEGGAEQGADASAASEESNTEKMRELERKLKYLCAQYQAVMESSAPEVVKEVQGKVIRKQIDDLMNQLSAAREQNMQTSVGQIAKAKA